MWTAIQYVTSGITLIAFICAIAALVYKSYLRGRERLINNAPEADRARLIEKTIVPFNIDTARLSRQHQYELALKQIGERTTKFLVVAVVIVVLAGLATFLAFTAMPRASSPPTPTPTPESLSAKIEQVEVVPEGDDASQIFILLSIENKGAPATIPKYDILINHVTSQSFEYSDTLETALKGEYTVPQAGGRGPLVIRPQDSLISQPRVAIGNGGKVKGWLRLVLPVAEKILAQPGTRYTISFTDPSGGIHEAVYEMK